MTPQQAIEFLDSILREANLSRRTHEVIIQALRVLTPQPVPATPSEKPDAV